jgi:hypothetical protein
MKLLAPLALLLTTLTGCELYFGGDGDSKDDHWTYCAADGYYDCYGDDCQWLSSTCPAEPGYECTDNQDCAAGCYCGTDGTCEEAGFCESEDDCSDGFHCDTDRSSCVPDSCTTSADCDAGEYCDGDGACVASCTCTTDADAQGAGFGYCDESRGTCEPPRDGGTCGGASTCNLIAPTCAAGQVPLIVDGCYSGECGDIASCDVTPTCEAIQHQSDCDTRTADCAEVVNGINCTNPNGVACSAGEANCTCESVVYASCRTQSAAMTVIESPMGSLTGFLAH